MKISYNWLNTYLPSGKAGLPEKLEPEKLSGILTSIGLEVESLEYYENFKGGLKGLVVGEVVSCKQHPNADKLKLTEVNIGSPELLQIVCGAPNVAIGQKVIVAPVGVVIYPLDNKPVTMKIAKIRGVESFGMICAEDEIGAGSSHEGIIVLPAETKPGTLVAELFEAYADWIYEIGLTPNRMDAMSHIGVAKDVCAWLSFHNNITASPILPFGEEPEIENHHKEFEVKVDSLDSCKRYSALMMQDVKVSASPVWLQNYLKAIGQRPINNIVDITNFILHETGQPLHAFDADAFTSKKVVVKKLADGTVFKTLDGIERKLSKDDLMICNDDEPVCIAGVFGGIGSGVTEETKNIFLESAWFSPSSIRPTSLKHGLRTEAAIRFEKGVDISGTVKALKRAAKLIIEFAGGKIAGDVVDIYPETADKKQIVLKFDYLKKLSGKQYAPAPVKKIFSALEFEILEENETEIKVAVPFSKADISMPADLVEEVLRIDGLNNIDIPSSVTIVPSVQENILSEEVKEKLSRMLIGLGFNEIVSNSITNSKNYTEESLLKVVKLLNNLSADLDIMRPSMLETGLESVAFNLNRKNNALHLFELGKVYCHEQGQYQEAEKICFWISNKNEKAVWGDQNYNQGFFKAKGIVIALLENINIKNILFTESLKQGIGNLQIMAGSNLQLGKLIRVDDARLQKFNIKQPVIYVELDVSNLVYTSAQQQILYEEIPQFPFMERDLSIVINDDIPYRSVESALRALKLKFLVGFKLFDIYEGEKIGPGKKSFAINFKFLNKAGTLTDTEVESEMKLISGRLIDDFNVEIRH